MNVKNLVTGLPKLLVQLVASPKFVTGLGIAVAMMQLVAAVETFSTAAKSRKKIGFNE